MKILYVSNQYGPHDRRFLRAIVDCGHSAFFLNLNSDHTYRDRLPLPRNTRLVRGKIKDVIARVKPDLIHAGPLTTCGYLVAKTGFHPLVQMSWGSDILFEAKRNLEACRRVQTALSQASAFIADCAAVRDAAVDLGFPSNRIVVFPWGVDLRRFTPKGSDEGLRKRLGWQHAFVLLHMRALEPLYDPAIVVRAFVRAAKQKPELRLLMPGAGSLLPRLKKLVRNSGMAGRVYFTGKVGQIDLPKYYRAANLYVSASKSDGSSVSLMEALACGLPALVSNIPGNREWVQPGKEGRLFPVGDAKTLANKILAMMEKPKELQRMAKQTRVTAQRRADWSLNKSKLCQAHSLALERAAS